MMFSLPVAVVAFVSVAVVSVSATGEYKLFLLPFRYCLLDVTAYE